MDEKTTNTSGLGCQFLNESKLLEMMEIVSEKAADKAASKAAELATKNTVTEMSNEIFDVLTNKALATVGKAVLEKSLWIVVLLFFVGVVYLQSQGHFIDVK